MYILKSNLHTCDKASYSGKSPSSTVNVEYLIGLGVASCMDFDDSELVGSQSLFVYIFSGS
jgi:hypothetical protein